MSDEPKKTELKIPEETKQKFPELIDYIQKSQSMDQEERQYWIDALPIMTEEQIDNLRGILKNEQEQIEKTKKEQAKNVQGIAKKYTVEFDDFKYREKKRLIKEAEIKEKTEDEKGLQDIMQEMQQL